MKTNDEQRRVVQLGSFSDQLARRARYYARGMQLFSHVPDGDRHERASRYAEIKLRRDVEPVDLVALYLKEDPYGTNIPSRVPRPVGGSGTPGRNFVGGVPERISNRNASVLLRQYLTSTEPQLIRILFGTWNAQASALKFGEISRAIARGDLEPARYEQWRQQYAAMVNEELAPQWRAAAQAAHGPLASQIRNATGTTVPFRETAAYLDAWIESRGAELIVQVSSTQRAAVRNIIRQLAVEDPIPPRELARYIRPVVGLTDRQSQAVVNFRQRLVDADELTSAQIAKRVEDYAGRLNRVRADRIARTELSFAYNQGHLSTMRAARDTNAITGVITKEFYTAIDERVCPFCEPLHRTTIELEETFPGLTNRLQNLWTPPVHPSCRCTVIYGVVS